MKTEFLYPDYYQEHSLFPATLEELREQVIGSYKPEDLEKLWEEFGLETYNWIWFPMVNLLELREHEIEEEKRILLFNSEFEDLEQELLQEDSIDLGYLEDDEYGEEILHQNNCEDEQTCFIMRHLYLFASKY